MVRYAGEQLFEQSNSNKNKDVFGSILFNVKSYGAKGDGSTDDYAAIVKTINACPAGGVVFFPTSEKPYRSSQTIIIDKPIKFMGVYSVYEVEDGAEKANVIEFDSSLTTGIEVTSYAVTIEGLSVVLKRTINDVVSCIFFNGPSSSDMRNCIVRNVNTANAHIYGAGIKSDGAITMTLENVKTFQGQFGFHFTCPIGVGTSVTFNRCWATNYALTGASGFYIENYEYVEFLNSTADSVNSPDHGYYLKNCFGVSMDAAACELTAGSNFYFDACTAVSMSGCFGVFGNVSGTGTANASFAELVNGTKFITMTSCTDHDSALYATPNVWCDASSQTPVVINCNLPKGISDNGVVAPIVANRRSYITVGSGSFNEVPGIAQTVSAFGLASPSRMLAVYSPDLSTLHGSIRGDGGFFVRNIAGLLPPPSASFRGVIYRVEGGPGVADHIYVCIKNAADAYVWQQMDN